MMIRLSVTLITLQSILSPTIHAKPPPPPPGQSQFLKEIITGRCYFQPPSGNPLDVNSCPSTIGSVMGILESHLDSDIEPTSFDPYIQKSSVVPPQDAALFYLSSIKATIPQNLVMPEDTPGGALLKDLVICGVDRRQNCDRASSHATLTFWQAVYSSFASEARGRVQLVLPDDEWDAFYKNLFESAIVPHINVKGSDVSSVVIYAKDCAGVETTSVMTELKETAGVKDVSCHEDGVRFLICQNPDADDCRKCQVLDGVRQGVRDHLPPRPHGVTPPDNVPPHGPGPVTPPDDVPPHGPGPVTPPDDVPPDGPGPAKDHDAMPPYVPEPDEPPHPPSDKDETQKMNVSEPSTETTTKKGHTFVSLFMTILIGCMIIYGLLSIKRFYYTTSGYQPIDPRPGMGSHLPPKQ